jgi:amino acid adenylation domain-containing protein
LLQELARLDVRVALHGEGLRVNAPRGVITAALRRRIAAGKSEIIGMLRRRAAIPRIAGDGPAPLSFAQERLWFLGELAPGGAVFNLSRAARITGALDRTALEAAFRELLRRHGALRTKFTAADGRPVQTVSPHESFSLERVKLSALPGRKREKRCAQLLLAAARRPFDLTRDALLRASLLELGDDEHVVIFSTHHIVADAWSMSILSRELWSLYESFSTGRPVALPEGAIRYGDYAAWQRRQFDDAFLEEHRNYWTRQLADAPELDLPPDRPRPAKRKFSGARRYFSFSEKLTAALNDLSRRARATPFMTLLSAFQILLYRYTGQEDIFVGSAAANRDRPELEGVIGLFVNTLVLRGDLSGAPSFNQFLRRVREICLEAYRHQAMPFEKLMEALNPQRDLERTPLFRAFFVLQNTPEGRPEPARLSLTPIEIESGATQFDLSLYLRERRGKLIGFLEYSTEVFDTPTIERMGGHFENLLEAIAADPDRSIAALPMLGVAERQRLLVEWNDTAVEYPKDRCIHELFEAQAEQTPDRIALECGVECLTYRALNERANAIAHELLRRGAGPGALIGVMLEPGFDMVSGLLAVLKSAAAYVPLDSSYPQERLRFMAEDAGIEILLTQKKFVGRLGARIVLPIDDRHFAKKDRLNPPWRVDSGSLAYVIYTSGSTGVPKGVMAPHRAAVNRFAWMWKTFPFERDEKNCQKTSFSFVDSVWEIFGALLQGAPTALVPEALAKDPEALVDYLMERRVTRLVAVPSLLDAILFRCDAAKKLARLKFCFSSGEPLSAELAVRFRRVFPGCRLINLYGSSEVAADVTYAEVGSDTSSVPIGRPIHNTRIYLLGPGLEPVPMGARGELYVGGDGVAPGYLHRPELTAERFVADPFSPDAAARLFRSGDLARYRANGNLEFLGRADAQVKIRGRRIEPGEIEAALNRHPAVRESAVAAQPSGATNSDSAMGLIAYLVARKKNPAAPGELQSFLGRTLPDFMVPAAFVWLDSLPRLPNGKMDRRALHQRENFQLGELGGKTAPRTQVENLVAQIWCEILGIDSIGVDDNFFERGGHSLLAAQVAAKMRAVFERPVALRDIFETPTVAGLAALAARTESEPEDLPALARSREKQATRLSFGQEQMFVFGQLFGGADFLNLPYGYRLDGRLDRAALKRAMEEMISRHEILRTAFIDDSAGACQIVRRRVAFKLPVMDLARLPTEDREAKLEAISRADAARAFDLETPPLLRATLIRLTEARHVLLITLHHLIADQWSMGVLRRELAALYEAFSQDRPSPLPALPFQYSDFARWQRRTIECGAFDRQIRYWKKALERPALRLDFQRHLKRKSAPRFQSARAPLRFEPGLLDRIKSFGREQGCTPFMIFVTALAILLRAHTGARDIRIGTLVANRGQSGTDGLIGYFVNALVLRLHVAPSMTARELLRHVRAVCLEAYAHQDVPFEHLEALFEREQKGVPLYQVMLNYRNLWTPALELNGLTIAPWDGKYRASDPGVAMSRLDVNFSIRELSTELTGAVTYKTDLFDERRMARLLADYFAVLKKILVSLEQRVAQIP